jgi:integrase
MKSRRRHDVPLSTQAVAILRELHKLSSDSGWLFPNSRDAKRPMGTSTLQRALDYLELDGTPHGFRHSASTALHDAGFDTFHREAARTRIGILRDVRTTWRRTCRSVAGCFSTGPTISMD